LQLIRSDKVLVVMLAYTLLTLARIANAAPAIDMSGYIMAGSNGGRGGLPEVKIWMTKSQKQLMNGGEHGWNYPQSRKPDNMHYTSWQFWRFGVSDALLQIISEQATDPVRGPVTLGEYFGVMTNSGLTCWSTKTASRAGLEVDITDTVPVTESCRADHYVTYGVTPQLLFNGNAKLLLTIDERRHVKADLISSTFSEHDTKDLLEAIKNLDGHPVLSFPDNAAKKDAVQLIAEFIIERKPGGLKLARPQR